LGGGQLLLYKRVLWKFALPPAPFKASTTVPSSFPPMRGSGILVEAGDMRRVAQVMVGIWFGCANLLEQVLIELRSLIDKRAAVLNVSQ
jgi:hypothetical protein